jgi:hypothetical protein
MTKLLTIGMSTFDDFDGVFFSIQSLRMYHSLCKTDYVEYIILDNNPNRPHGEACKSFAKSSPNIRYIPLYDSPSSFNKYKVYDYANGKYILIIDSHVLIERGGIESLIEYFKNNPNCKNLIQGPLLYDDLENISTHFDPKWSGGMYGVWETNKKQYDEGLPFDIPMQGMGLLAYEKESWKGINQHFKGFGGEEGYIGEKFRQWGGKNICLPSLRWNHRFGRPNGIKYPLILEDRIWNYYIGWLELTKDPNHIMIKQITDHFKDKISTQTLQTLLNRAKKVLNINE